MNCKCSECLATYVYARVRFRENFFATIDQCDLRIIDVPFSVENRKESNQQQYICAIVTCALNAQ